MAGVARRAAALRYARPQGRPVSLLPSDVSQRLSRSRRPRLAHGLPGRRHQLQHSPCRAHEDRSRHRRRGKATPNISSCAAAATTTSSTARSSTSKMPAPPSSATPTSPSCRTYLLKGGFMWSDDFWGSRAWDSVGAARSGACCRQSAYPIVDIPVTHAMFQTVYSVKRILQVPAISRWRLQRRRDVRAGTRQRGRQHARDLRREGPPDGADDPQHGHFGHVGA